VVDVSHPSFEDQMQTVNETLLEIGVLNQPVITVFNKIDLYNPKPSSDDIFEDQTIYNLDELRKSWMGRLDENVVFISAEKATNIAELRERIMRNLSY
jgi:GTP-binding protein HflX